MPKHISELSGLLQSPKKIVITTHEKPDGDAIGSSLGMYHYLKAKGHDVIVITPTDYAGFLHWLPGNDQVIIFTFNKQKCKQLVEEAELIFCLDFNVLKRINDLGKYVANSSARKVLIDHHPEPDDFADYMMSDTSASSTAELVFNFIEMMGDKNLMDKNMAECIYAGILTDTGSFQYATTTPKVHRITAELVEKGVSGSDAYNRIFNSFTENRLRFYGYCLTEKMQVFPEYKAALIAVTADELKKFNVGAGDTEGLVNFPLKISSIIFATLIIDRTEIIKISFRSQGSFDVNEFARKHFDGGGHASASGGSSKTTLEETVNKFLEVLPSYREALNKEN